MCIRFFFRNDLCREMLFQLAGEEIQKKDPVFVSAGCIRIRLSLPRQQVHVVAYDDVDPPLEIGGEIGEVSSVVLIEDIDIETVTAVLHEKFVRRVNGYGKPPGPQRFGHAAGEGRFSGSGNGTVDDHCFMKVSVCTIQHGRLSLIGVVIGDTCDLNCICPVIAGEIQTQSIKEIGGVVSLGFCR